LNNKYYKNLHYAVFFGLLCYATGPAPQIIFIDFKALACISIPCEGPGYHVRNRLAHIKDVTNSYSKKYKRMKTNTKALSGKKKLVI
jgi:hypothetical protein